MQDDFNLNVPLLNWLTAPGSIARHQLLRGRKVEITLDWSDPNVPTGTMFVRVLLLMGSETFWIEKEVTDQQATLEFDLAELSCRWDADDLSVFSGVPIWFSNDLEVTTVPEVAMWVYQQDPDNAMDDLERITNLLYVDSVYLKMEYDLDYMRQYRSRLSSQETYYEDNKKWLALVGGGMAIGGLVTGNPELVFWGSDMLIQTYTGKSILDHISHTVMDFLGFDDETIERFSVWQMTSNRGLNLLLQEAFANQLSGVIRRGTTRIAGRIMASLDNVVDDIVSNSRAVSASEQSWLMRRVDDLFQWVDKPEWAPAAKTVLGGIMSYVGLVGEVVFEMAFESAFNADEEGRPAGGPAMFAIAMTLSVVTQTAMTRLATGIVDSPSAYRKQMKIQLSLVLVSMSLSVAQIYMRYPVMMANMK